MQTRDCGRDFNVFYVFATTIVTASLVFEIKDCDATIITILNRENYS